MSMEKPILFEKGRRGKAILPSLLLAIVCAAGVIVSRMLPDSSVINIGGIPFAYSDFFVIIAGAVGGLLSGMTSFSILFVAEILRLGGDYYALYTIFTYLVVILISARLSYIGGFKTPVRTLGCVALLAGVPIAYLFNLFILKFVVRPVNAMSHAMEQYFETDERGRIRRLPDLEIHTGDEVERLYHSLEKMVEDMSRYIARMTEQERKTAHLTKGFMAALAKAVDEKDHYTSGHSERVAKYAKELAKRMGKTEAEQEEIYVMGLLHDIGKIGVPESIINKQGKPV